MTLHCSTALGAVFKSLHNVSNAGHRAIVSSKPSELIQGLAEINGTECRSTLDHRLPIVGTTERGPRSVTLFLKSHQVEVGVLHYDTQTNRLVLEGFHGRIFGMRAILCLLIKMSPAIDHSKPIDVGKQRVVGRGVSLPRCVANEGNILGFRRMQLQRGSAVLIDENIVNEQFSTRSNVNSRRFRSQCRQRVLSCYNRYVKNPTSIP